MGFGFIAKPIIPTKQALDELSDIDLDLEGAQQILDEGFEVRKREKGVIERGISRGKKVINVVVVDCGSHYKLIHAGQFTLTKKFRRKQHGLR
jgi:hypothetical protein